MSPEATYVLESLATVAVFGAALVATTWGIRRLGIAGVAGKPSERAIEVIARQPLDGRRAIYLVRVGKRVLVVGASDGALTRLGSTSVAALGVDLDATSAARPAASFRETLRRVLGR